MIRVHANGFPKHGNHALVKALQLLGVPCRVQHIPWSEEMAYRDAPRVFVVRDPRDAVVSMLRMKGQPVTPGTVLTRLRQWGDEEAGTLAEAMAAFEGWLDDPATLVVRLGALRASDAEMRRIAAWLGVPYLAGAWEALPGLTMTWNDTASDHRPVWTPEVEAGWREIGGPALLARWVR